MDNNRLAQLDAMNGFLSRAVAQSPQGVCLLEGPEHVFVSANAAYQAIIPGRELLGRTVRAVFPEIESQGVYELLDKVYHTGEPVMMTALPLQLETSPGAPLRQAYFNFTYQPVRRDDGTVQGVLALVTEVTNEVNDQLALRRSDERYQALARTDTQFVWGTGPSGLVEDMPEWRHFTGQTLDEVRGTGWANAVHPDDRDHTAAAWATAVEKKALYEVEYRAQHHEGGYRWLRVRGVPVLETDGTIREWIGTADDITRQKDLLNALKRSEARYELAALATNDAIWDWDLTTDGLEWNAGVQSLFGYTASQVEPGIEWWYEHIHPEDRERVVSGIHAVIDHGGQVWTDGYRFLRGDGTYAWVTDRGYCVHDEHGKPRRMVGAMHDHSQQRAAEDAAQAAYEELQASNEELQVQREELESLNIQLREQNERIEAEVERRTAEHQRLADILRDLAEGLTSSGEDYFAQLSSYLAQALHVDYVLLGQLVGESQDHVQTVALHAHGKPTGPMTYRLAGTPCENVVSKQLCSYPTGVQQLFPDDQELVDLGIESYVGTPLFGFDGRVLGLIVVMHSKEIEDVPLVETLLRVVAKRTESELERMEADRMLARNQEELLRANTELQALDRMKDEFLSALSVQLGTPINTAQGYLDVLSDGVVGVLLPPQESYVRKIRAHMGLLEAMVNDLLDLSRLSGGKFVLTCHPVDLPA
ncbi:MAG: PAS domain-containing protein, partial [Candidatus Sericytochromatia bacterium]